MSTLTLISTGLELVDNIVKNETNRQLALENAYYNISQANLQSYKLKSSAADTSLQYKVDALKELQTSKNIRRETINEIKSFDSKKSQEIGSLKNQFIRSGVAITDSALMVIAGAEDEVLRQRSIRYARGDLEAVRRETLAKTLNLKANYILEKADTQASLLTSEAKIRNSMIGHSTLLNNAKNSINLFTSSTKSFAKNKYDTNKDKKVKTI